MMVSFPLWLIPVVATLLLWAAVLLWPIRPSRGDYDFGPSLIALARLVGGVIATLAIWLGWFVFLAFSGGAS